MSATCEPRRQQHRGPGAAGRTEQHQGKRHSSRSHLHLQPSGWTKARARACTQVATWLGAEVRVSDLESGEWWGGGVCAPCKASRT